TATHQTPIYALSLHDALPICRGYRRGARRGGVVDEGIRRPVSRVLCRPLAETRRPFLWTGPRGTVLATYPDPSDRRRSYPPSPRLGRARDPYSVLLLAGLAMPCLLPATRWALTPPFHPSPGKPGRFAFCGAVPGVAPGGRYPPPCRRGARTFLDPLAEAAIARPSGPRGKWSLRPERSSGGARAPLPWQGRPRPCRPSGGRVAGNGLR